MHSLKSDEKSRKYYGGIPSGPRGGWAKNNN